MPLAGENVRASDIPDRFGCTLRRAAVQNTGSGVTGTVSWDTEDEDTDGFWSSGTTITIPAGGDGIYTICTRLAATGLGAGRAFAQIVPTSTIVGTPIDFRTVVDDVEERAFITAQLELAAGDSYVVQYGQFSGAGQDWTAWTSCYRTSF